MRVKYLIPSGRLLGAALAAGCLTLASCATRKVPCPGAAFSIVQSSFDFWKPELLYLQASPHARLYVEVDAVEGCEPSESALNELRDFLATYCDKPDGIEIVRSDMIPKKKAQGITTKGLARQFLNGPPTDSSVPAFIYVLIYNGRLCNLPGDGETGHQGAQKGPRYHASYPYGHIIRNQYPTMIYLNGRHLGSKLYPHVLQHEAGHVLGLGLRPETKSDGHCRNRDCLMHKTLYPPIIRLFLGGNPFTPIKLCDLCESRLEESVRQKPSSNLRFVGPVLVRSEVDYHVLNLPPGMKVVVGDLAEQDCRDFASAVRTETAFPGDHDERYEYFAGQVKPDMTRTVAELCAILERAKADPCVSVRILASNCWFRAETERYCSLNEYSNAIEICRQAIHSNPIVDWSYNQFAWIKATCNEASVRDGKEAVAAARKACELTQWKVSAYIDTLAAAYAEAGDFKLAIQFGEQALRTHQPGESDQKEIQARVELYKQSLPFRNKPEDLGTRSLKAAD